MAAESGCESMPSESVSFFFFNSRRFTTNPLIDPLTLLGLFGSFLEPRTPTFTSDRRFPFASSKLPIYAERKLHRFDFFRTLASYPSLDALFLSLSLSRVDGLSFSRFNASFQCSLRNSTVYWPTRHGNVSKPPTNGMVALRVGHARSRTDHIFTRVRGVKRKNWPGLCRSIIDDRRSSSLTMEVDIIATIGPDYKRTMLLTEL